LAKTSSKPNVNCVILLHAMIPILSRLPSSLAIVQ
jgi:hypothetical protein